MAKAKLVKDKTGDEPWWKVNRFSVLLMQQQSGQQQGWSGKSRSTGVSTYNDTAHKHITHCSPD